MLATISDGGDRFIDVPAKTITLRSATSEPLYSLSQYKSPFRRQERRSGLTDGI
jgi:hypothetical protein